MWLCLESGETTAGPGAGAWERNSWWMGLRVGWVQGEWVPVLFCLPEMP